MNVPPRVATSGWHLAWRAETAFPIVTATPTSCRFLAKLSSAGTRLQAEFSGQANPRGYTILGASVALPTGPTSLTVAPGSSIPLTFGGKPGVTVGPGARIVSDSVPFVTVDNGPVLVTVSASAGDAYGKGELSEPGGCSASSVVPSAAAAPASAFAARPGYVRWLRSLLVDGPPQRSTAVLGDSITEGPGPQVMGNYPRWTDVLTVGGSDVVNAGVGGNALTRTGMFGTASGESRATALLAEPNLTDLVICLGTNDLVFGASGQQVLDSIDRVVAKARSLGVRTWVCTIAPRYREGWTAYGENQRLLINNSVRGAWLKSRGASVIDVDAALRNPSIPHSMQAAYDSGDHIHPNVLGSYVIGLTALHAMNLPAARPAGPAPTPSATSPSPTSVPSSTLSQLAQLRLVL
ncbi:MAG TPA: GDSL-type esterase/lipase family protein [Frankiaceae bacterium]|nr:GDSL-type esterase/lipase family protein [Frankiaceae bacterium]